MGGPMSPADLTTFFAVVREGVETALLLQAAFLSTGEVTAFGPLLGLAVAIALGVLIYGFGVRIDLRRFFQVTAVVLLLFAAGLVSHAAHEFAEAGFLPEIVERMWDTRAALPDDTGAGAILRALFGYSDHPSLLEVIVYAGYVALVIVLVMACVNGDRVAAEATLGRALYVIESGGEVEVVAHHIDVT